MDKCPWCEGSGHPPGEHPRQFIVLDEFAEYAPVEYSPGYYEHFSGHAKPPRTIVNDFNGTVSVRTEAHGN